MLLWCCLESHVVWLPSGLSDPIVRAITERGYTVPTPIQRQAIPAVLAGGGYLPALKPAPVKQPASLPILHRLSTSQPVTGGRAPIRADRRRELAAGRENVRDYGKYLKLSSMVMLAGSAFVFHSSWGRIGYSGRHAGPLLDHAGQRTVDLSRVEVLVLDEADRMLDMGFIHDIKKYSRCYLVSGRIPAVLRHHLR